jgi:hypothetical protein
MLTRSEKLRLIEEVEKHVASMESLGFERVQVMCNEDPHDDDNPGFHVAISLTMRPGLTPEEERKYIL